MLARSGMFVLLVVASALAGPSELPAPLPPLPPNAPLPAAPALATPLAPVAPRDDLTAKPVVLEEFTIAKNGDAILVPVTVAGKTRMFLLDTGLTYTAIDLPVLKGAPVETVALTAAEGSNVAAPIFNPPEASVGRLGFRGVYKVMNGHGSLSGDEWPSH